MIDLIDALYLKFYLRKKFIGSRLIRRLILKSINCCLILILNRFTYLFWYLLVLLRKESGRCCRQSVVFSMTSYPKRIKGTWKSVLCLILQKDISAVVYLWLSKDDYKCANKLPLSLRLLERYGLNIIIKDDNLRSHKKYMYLKEILRNNDVILVDDDLIYPSNMSRQLVDSSREKNKIRARYTKEMIRNESGMICLYNSWSVTDKNKYKNDLLFFCTGGGTLLPKGDYNEIWFDQEAAMKVTPKADDLWLNAVARYTNKKIEIAAHTPVCLESTILNKDRLSNYNLSGGNDIQIQSINAYFEEKYRFTPF